jgi:hypothetical protein
MRDAGRRGDAAAKTRGDAATKTRRRRGASRSALRTAGATRNGHAQPPARSRMPPDNHRSGGIRPSRTNRRPPPLRRGRGEPSGFPRGEVEGQRPSDLRHAKHRSGASSSDDGPREPAQACPASAGAKAEAERRETRGKDARRRRETAIRSHPPVRACRQTTIAAEASALAARTADHVPCGGVAGNRQGSPAGRWRGSAPPICDMPNIGAAPAAVTTVPASLPKLASASAGAKAEAERRETRGKDARRRRETAMRSHPPVRACRQTTIAAEASAVAVRTADHVPCGGVAGNRQGSPAGRRRGSAPPICDMPNIGAASAAVTTVPASLPKLAPRPRGRRRRDARRGATGRRGGAEARR